MCKLFKKIPDSYIGKWISLIASVFTVITLYLTYYQLDIARIANEINVNPTLEIFWKYYHPGMDLNIVDATSTVELTLFNKSISTLSNIKLFADYYTVSQDKNNISNLWACNWNSSQVASTSQLSSLDMFSFQFPMVDFYAKDGYVMSVAPYVNSAPFIRVRVQAEKKVDNSPFQQDFFFEAYDNRTLFKSDANISFYMQSKYGSLDASDMIDLIRNTSTGNTDVRCFEDLIIKKHGGSSIKVLPARMF